MFVKHMFPGGTHPHEGVNGKAVNSGNAIRELPAPARVVIPLSQHIGAPCKPIVQKGDLVLAGQKIGEAGGFVSAPVHSSVSGKVVGIEPVELANGSTVSAVVIENDFQNNWVELHPAEHPETLTAQELQTIVREAGIVGMGGATFPTQVKITPPKGKTIEKLVINGAECEPYLTADHRLMLENPVRVVDGLRAAMRAINVKEGIIAIEDNKPDAIEAMRKACQGREGVRVQVLKTKYPQGGEKQLIEAVTGRQVPSGGLPIQAGVIVMNVATCAAVADAVIDGKPLVERIVTVTGAVRQPANLRLRIGTITEDIIGECGGFSGDVGKVIFGGAMTGMCAPNTSIPIAKATGGILVLDKQDAASVEEGPCLRCGKCVEVCPIGLHPLKIKIAADADRIDECKRLHVMDCTLCGSCSFICPAHRWLTASFKVAKQKLAAQAKKGGSGK